ncbi:MAG: NADPH-dependent F420 reductase [Terriglobales bacterium]
MTDTVAIIGGTGPEGRGLAVRWARAGLNVILGSRDENRARMAAQELCDLLSRSARVTGAENTAAVHQADVVVLAVPFEAQVQTLKSLNKAFRPNAVLITTTVPLATSVGDRGSRVIGVWQGSAAEQAAELVPNGVKVVAAFQNISAALLTREGPIECDAIICSDHKDARQAASELAELIPGVRAIDGGRLENSRIVEQITALLVGINIRYKVHGGGIRITGV